MVDQKLKLFCLIAEHESFSKAGEMIGMSQPGVSRQVRALEDTYGAKLFKRSGGRVILTEAGERLHKYAGKINAYFSTAKNEINSCIDPSSEFIPIGSCHIMGNYVLPDYIAQFNRNHKDIKIKLIIDESRNILDAVSEKRIDFGVIEGKGRGSKLVAKKFCSDRIVVILSPHHKWSKRKKLSALDVLKEPTILRERGCMEREILETCLLKHGIQLEESKAVFVTGTTESVKNAVESGIGLSFASQWAVQKECSSGRLKQALLKENGGYQESSLVHRKNGGYSPSSATFLKYLDDNPVNVLC
jgi:DNA-binding transcriptional LysR family regulator